MLPSVQKRGSEIVSFESSKIQNTIARPSELEWPLVASKCHQEWDKRCYPVCEARFWTCLRGKNEVIQCTNLTDVSTSSERRSHFPHVSRARSTDCRKLHSSSTNCPSAISVGARLSSATVSKLPRSSSSEPWFTANLGLGNALDVLIMRVIVAMALPSAWLKSRTPCLSHPGHKNVEKKKKKAEKAAGEEQKNDAAKNSAAEPQPGAEEAAGAEQENDAAKDAAAEPQHGTEKAIGADQKNDNKAEKDAAAEPQIGAEQATGAEQKNDAEKAAAAIKLKRLEKKLKKSKWKERQERTPTTKRLEQKKKQLQADLKDAQKEIDGLA